MSPRLFPRPARPSWLPGHYRRLPDRSQSENRSAQDPHRSTGSAKRLASSPASMRTIACPPKMMPEHRSHMMVVVFKVDPSPIVP